MIGDKELNILQRQLKVRLRRIEELCLRTIALLCITYSLQIVSVEFDSQFFVQKLVVCNGLGCDDENEGETQTVEREMKTLINLTKDLLGLPSANI